MEPASNTTAGIMFATGAISISGSILGLQYDLLLFGLFGGLVSLMHLPPMTKGKMAATLLVASLLGALAAPILVAVAFGMAAQYAWMAWVKIVADSLLRCALAFAVGLLAQWLIPIVISAAAKKGAQV